MRLPGCVGIFSVKVGICSELETHVGIVSLCSESKLLQLSIAGDIGLRTGPNAQVQNTHSWYQDCT
jgi:hypothetical protein